MFFTTSEMQKYCHQRKVEPIFAIIEVRFFKGGYSFIRQSVNTAKVECLNLAALLGTFMSA